MTVQAAGAIRQMGEQAFAELLVPLLQTGYRLACALLHDPEAAQDVLQESSLIAWRKLHKLPDGAAVRSWFLGIVANECRNARRRKWVWGVTLGLPDRISVSSGEDRLLRGEDLRRALRGLNHDDRLVIACYFYLDMPIRDIAAVAHAKEDATRARLHRAVRRLRPDLEIEEALR